MLSRADASGATPSSRIATARNGDEDPGLVSSAETRFRSPSISEAFAVIIVVMVVDPPLEGRESILNSGGEIRTPEIIGAEPVGSIVATSVSSQPCNTRSKKLKRQIVLTKLVNVRPGWYKKTEHLKLNEVVRWSDVMELDSLSSVRIELTFLLV